LLRELDTSLQQGNTWCSWEFPCCSASTEGHRCCSTCWWHKSVLSSLCQLSLLWISVFIYLKEYSDTEEFLTYPSEKLVEAVAAVTVIESMMAEVAHLNSLEQLITSVIKSSIDFEWIRCTGSSLHRQQIIDVWRLSLAKTQPH
jgi:hypothetical protein